MFQFFALFKHFLFFIILLLFCYNCPNFSPFALLHPSHPPLPSQFPPYCPCPWVIHTHSLSSPFPFFLPLSPSSSSVFTFSLFHIFMSVVLFHVVPFLFLFLFCFWSFLFSALYLFFLSTFSSQKEAWLSSDWSLFVLYIIEFLPYPETVSYTHLTLPTTGSLCRSRWSPYH